MFDIVDRSLAFYFTHIQTFYWMSHMYADDIKIFMKVNSLKVVLNLQPNLDAVSSRLVSNKYISSKCHVLYGFVRAAVKLR